MKSATATDALWDAVHSVTVTDILCIGAFLWAIAFLSGRCVPAAALAGSPLRVPRSECGVGVGVCTCSLWRWQVAVAGHGWPFYVVCRLPPPGWVSCRTALFGKQGSSRCAGRHIAAACLCVQHMCCLGFGWPHVDSAVCCTLYCLWPAGPRQAGCGAPWLDLMACPCVCLSTGHGELSLLLIVIRLRPCVGQGDMAVPVTEAHLAWKQQHPQSQGHIHNAGGLQLLVCSFLTHNIGPGLVY